MQDESNEDISLEVPLCTVCFIAEKAQELQVKAGSSAPEYGVDEDDPEAEILEDRGLDPVEQELASVISDLSDEAQMDLVALMWLGRDGGDWAELRGIAEQEHTQRTAEYLCGTPLLATYLLDGLNAIGLDCAEWRAENS